MVKEHLKNIGRIVLFICIFAGQVYANKPYSYSINTTTVGVGEPAIIRLTITGSEISDLSVPEVDGLLIQNRGQSISTSMNSFFGKSQREVALTYIVVGKAIKTYTVPPFSFIVDGKQYKTRSINLKVVKGSTQKTIARGNGVSLKVKSDVWCNKKKVYVGEPIVVRYFLVSNSPDYEFKGLKDNYVTKNFVYKQVTEPQFEEQTDTSESGKLKKYLFTLIYVPTQKGTFPVGGGTGVIGVESEEDDMDPFFSGRRRRVFGRSFFTQMIRKAVPFERPKITVMPLPESARQRNYQGNIGSYAIEVEYDNKKMQQFDEKKVTVVIKGSGNLLAVSKPFFEKSNSGVKVLSESSEPEVMIENDVLTGKRIFTFTLIPQQGGKINMGPLHFNFFNPKTRQYQSITSKDIVLNVAGEKGTGNDKEKLNLSRQTEVVYFNTGIVISIIVGLAVIVLLFFLWERKRYKEVVGGSDQDSEKDPEPDFTEKRRMLLQQLTTAKNEKDSDAFLKYADALLLVSIDNQPDSEVKQQLNHIKDKLYAIKFGGGVLSEKEMSDMFDKISGLV